MDRNLDFIRNCPGKHNLVCKPCFLIHYKVILAAVYHEQVLLHDAKKANKGRSR